jgi:hypothetical protein
MSEEKSGNNLVTNWAEAQQKVLTGWLDLVQESEHLSRKLAWNETFRAWKSAVQKTLDTQDNWLLDWTWRVQVTSGSPTALRKNVQQAQVLFLRWTEGQKLLWQGWFDLLQQFGPLLEADSQADEHLLHTLRKSGQAIIDAQNEWLQHRTKYVIDG